MSEKSEDKLSRAVEVLRDIGEGESGLGFCYPGDPQLFAPALQRGLADGPLVVALDTNILIDLQKFGSRLLNGDAPRPPEVSKKASVELEALSLILDLWLVRDIRLVPLHAANGDFRKQPAHERSELRREGLAGIASALAYQLGFVEWDWISATGATDKSTIDPASIPGDADRLLVQISQNLEVDVFLTADERVLRSSVYADVSVSIWRPSELATWLKDNGVAHLTGGTLQHLNCAYRAPQLFGDSGKWTLLEIFQ